MGLKNKSLIGGWLIMATKIYRRQTCHTHLKTGYTKIVEQKDKHLTIIEICTN